MSTDFDVLVVGGGAVGLVCARLLATASPQCAALRIGVLENHPPEPPQEAADIDLRVSAIAPASRNVLERADIWQALGPRYRAPYREMVVWQQGGVAGESRSIRFSAAEVGEPELGFIVENRALRFAAWALLQESANVSLRTESGFAGVSEQQDCCQVELANGKRLTTRLLIGADGVRSPVRKSLGIPFREKLYGQSAIVAHVRSEREHAQTAWQCFLPGGPVALLPLSDGRSSLVWSCPDELAAELLALDDAAFAERLGDATDHVLGHFEVSSPRLSFPLGSGYARRYTGRRYALIGDAAHRVHPLAGQGVNLGLLDAVALVDELARHMQLPAADPGDPRALRPYERSRKGDNLLTLGAMDALNRLFGSPAADIGGFALGVIERSGPLKSSLARYAMNHGR